MSKSIYEETINDVENLHKCLGDKSSRDISAKNILHALEQAHKQAKLLELYRKYKEVSKITFYTINYKTMVENTRIAKELIKQINQLEKELENE